MKIIFLNISHGQFFDKSLNFFRDQLDRTDAFCFMEVNPDLHQKLSEVFVGYNSIFEEAGPSDFIDGRIDGQSIFLKNDWDVLSHGKWEIFKITTKDVGILQFLRVRKEELTFDIGNVHGMYLPGTKFDTPARIRQSGKIINFFRNKKGPKIIGGDFNLMPETRSVKMFEESDYRNLIRDFNIKETRNRLSWEQFPGEEKQHFADYVFVSKDVKVKKFEVPNVEISDHLPLVLDFDLPAGEVGI